MRLRVKAGLAVMAGVAWLPASGQSPAEDAPAANIVRILATNPRTTGADSGEVVREIDDPHTGDRWELMRDAVHPEGPGRMVLVKASGTRLASSGPGDRPLPDARSANRPLLGPVIHAGDVLIVEEHTAVVEARLEAVALGPAVHGAVIQARLKIGKKVVRVVAVSAGRAVFAPEEAAEP